MSITDVQAIEVLHGKRVNGRYTLEFPAQHFEESNHFGFECHEYDLPVSKVQFSEISEYGNFIRVKYFVVHGEGSEAVRYGCALTLDLDQIKNLAGLLNEAIEQIESR